MFHRVWLVSALGVAASGAACGGSSSDQPVVSGGNAYAPQQTQPGPAPQPGTYAPQQAMAPATPTTPPPSPLSPPCTELTAPVVCGTHRCNPQNGRCSLPCGSSTDCIPGFSCMGAGGPAAICVPGGN